METGCAGKKRACDGVYNRVFKRILDVVASVLILALIWPVLLLAAAAIALEDGFPVLYRAPRGGYGGKPFQICKFRTMVKNADRLGGGTTALHDPRITRVGSFLRKTKIDEFPQFFQVFTGTMSLIGPRPELLQYTSRYQGEELDIFQVRPGITDYSSIEFINLDEIVGGEDADAKYETLVLPRKNALRVRYAHTVSLKTDLYLLWKTAVSVGGKIFGFLFQHKHR